MVSSTASELDFDTVLKLVAAHARTRVGRFFVTDAPTLPDRHQALEYAEMTRELSALLDDGERLPLAGIDEAVQWLEPEATIPIEPADLLVLLGLARRTASVRRKLSAAPEALTHLKAMGQDLPDTEELVAWAAPRLGRDGRVPDDASPELGRVRRAITRIRQHLVAELETIRRRHPGVTTDAPPTLRRDRYCLPVKASARAQLPGLVLDSSGTGVTAFVEPFGVVDLNNDLTDATAKERREVQRILAEVAAAFGAIKSDLAEAVQTLGRIDAVQARLLFGRLINGLLLEPGGGTALALNQARHPLLDERLQALRTEILGEQTRSGRIQSVVPLDFEFPDDSVTLLISGPNAGGKTIVLKTIGLMVLMCYHGIPIPVSPGSTVPWFDHVWCRIGDDQDVSADLSTFSGAMATTAQLFEEAGPASLVIYDELGSGTDPLEGAALGCAVLQALTGRGCRTVATTHLASIALAASSADGMDNAAMEFDEARGRPTYTIRMGRPGRSRGLEIAAAMGLPPSVIDHARDLLGGHHLELDRRLERLEELEGELINEKIALSREKAAATAAGARADDERRKFEEQRQELPSLLEDERNRLRDRAKSRLNKALAKLDTATEEHRHIGRKARQNIRDEALDLGTAANGEPAPAPGHLEPGMTVRLRSLGAEGVLQELRDGQARVIVGSKRLWVAAGDIEAARKPPAQKKSETVRLEMEDREAPELILLGLDAEEARERVERYLDRAHAGGLTTIRIVHGHGTGTLKRVVTEIVKTH
ncbi:MAG: Smr/MutS family protein, partial [Acidobacteriota bacterium]